MSIKELSLKIIELVGTKDNIVSATNCMTRMRIHVKDDSAINDEALRETEGVLFLVHDQQKYVEVVVGPGKSRKCADVFKEEGIPVSAEESEDSSSAGKSDSSVSADKTEGSAVVNGKVSEDWRSNKQKVKSAQKDSKIKTLLKAFGEIFAPLIPGVIASGICAGIAIIIAQVNPNYADDKVWNVIYNFLVLIQTSFITYLTAWAGYRAAEKFGGTPILGGMLGMITTLSNIDTIATTLGLYDENQPLNAILRSGRGGVLAAVVGVWVMCKVEKAVRNKMPDALDTVFTPLITLVVTVVPYVFVVMPLTGLVSTGLCKIVELVALSSNPFIRMLAGYLGAALFLPMVAAGMHHGLVALYTVQLETFGYITLYPALAMAGAGQVGAAIAIFIKARKVGNKRICNVIGGALPAGVLGVGEPLIYGVTLPMCKPFLTAGLGAGFGGAFVMLMEVAATTWGPSGLLGIFVMTAGPNGAGKSIAFYLIGFFISVIMGFILTWFGIKNEEVRDA